MPRFQVNIYQKISARASRSHYLLKGIRILFMNITKKKCLKCPVFRSLYKKNSARASRSHCLFQEIRFLFMNITKSA